jgi:hypothetical protein
MTPSRSKWRPSSAEIRGVYVAHNKLSVHSPDVYVLRSDSVAIMDARHGETEAHWHPAYDYAQSEQFVDSLRGHHRE